MRLSLLTIALAALVAACGSTPASVAQEEGDGPEAAILESPGAMTAESIHEEEGDDPEAVVPENAGAITTESVEQEDGNSPESTMLENPIAMTAESIEAGEKLFMRRCRGCHGSDAMGGPPKEAGEAPTPNLVDHEYEYGSTDGDIFSVVRNGVPPELVMEPYDDRLDETDTWNVINFIRSLQQAHHGE